jgi:hypothetical protein
MNRTSPQNDGALAVHQADDDDGIGALAKYSGSELFILPSQTGRFFTSSTSGIAWTQGK